MKIKDLIKELKYYDEETEFEIKLVVNPHDSKEDVSVNWIGEIDTSLLEQGYIEFGVEKIAEELSKDKHQGRIEI